jgi:phosphoglycolate phosphatase
MEIKACIFDLDGTLLNTLSTITYYVNAALAREGAPAIAEEKCREMIGKGARNLLSRALASVGASVSDFEGFFCAYDAHYNGAPDYLTAPYEGILEMIEKIRGAGMRIAVLSNKPEGAVRPLVEKFFGDRVSFVAGGKKGVPLKPDPAAVFPLLSELALRADQTVFIGDSGEDILTAKNYGAGCSIGVLWGYRDEKELAERGADFLAKTPKDILKALGIS